VFQDCEDAIGPIADELDALDPPAPPASSTSSARGRSSRHGGPTRSSRPLAQRRPVAEHALLRFIDETFARKAKEIEKAANPAPVDPDTQPIDVIDEDSERAMLSASVHEEKSKVRLLFNALKVPIGWLTNQAGTWRQLAAKVPPPPTRRARWGISAANVLEEAVVSMLKRRWHDKKIGRLDALLEAAEHVENEKDLVLINYYIEELGADAEARASGRGDPRSPRAVARSAPRSPHRRAGSSTGLGPCREGRRRVRRGVGKGEDIGHRCGTATDGFAS
jgi:hypothetical protein